MERRWYWLGEVGVRRRWKVGGEKIRDGIPAFWAWEPLPVI